MVLAPMITDVTTGWASSHAIDTCASVTPRASAMAPAASSARVADFGVDGREREARPAPSLAACEKPARERAPHEEAEVLAGAERHDLVLHVVTDE